MSARPVPERLLTGRKVVIHQLGAKTSAKLFVPYSVKPGPDGGFAIGRIRFVLHQIIRPAPRRPGQLVNRPEDKVTEWLETPGHLIPEAWFVELGAEEEPA